VLDRATHLKIVALVAGIAIAGLAYCPVRQFIHPHCRRCQSWQADDDNSFGCFGYSIIEKRVIWTLENDRVAGDWDPAVLRAFASEAQLASVSLLNPKRTSNLFSKTDAQPEFEVFRLLNAR